MSYIKAEEILPEALIRQIQEYADGLYIYIPRKPGKAESHAQIFVSSILAPPPCGEFFR